MEKYSPITFQEINNFSNFVKDYKIGYDIAIWNSLAEILWNKLEAHPRLKKRIHGYYLPLFFWSLQVLQSSPISSRPIIIGINGPQGVGKTTITQIFISLFEQVNLRADALSIDDFYLTRSDQEKLAQAYPSNSLLQQRGYPGTHDISMGTKTLAALKNINSSDSHFLRLPRYDKTKHNGQGDRLPESEWKQLQPPVDLVFFDGWMLGFSEIPPDLINSEELKLTNSLLKPYSAWLQYLDGFIHIIPESLDYITHWRVEAEERSKALGRPGMSREEITQYIHKFIPAYQLYLPQLQAYPSINKNYLKLFVGEDRLPI